MSKKCFTCGEELYWEGHPFLRFWKCHNKCKKIFPEVYRLAERVNTTKDAEELIKTYGDVINVVRTNGKKETNWCIFGNAYKEHKDDNFWVEVRHIDKNKSKIVKLDDLDKWNNKIL